MAEVPLPGGNTTGAVLIDGVIHKRASPWAPTVHALLRYLEEAYGQMALVMAWASHTEYRRSGQRWVRTSRS